MLNSDYLSLCPVKLPTWRGRQHYMHGFDIVSPSMPKGFDDYIEPVKTLCEAARLTRGTVFVTVDEKVITPGMSQRRPGPHVDGCFMPTANKWGHPGDPGPSWNHYCNNVPVARMPIIVVASVEGCRAWRGCFHTEPKEDGDLSHIAHKLGEGVVLPANHGYLLSPDCIHESMTFEKATKRTFLRVALPPSFARTYWN